MPITTPVDRWISNHWLMTDHSVNRDHILRMLYDADYTGYGVEVGTFAGIFAERILQRTTIKKLFCVDPYISYDAYIDLMNNLDLSQVFATAQQRLAPYGSRHEFTRQTSVDAATAHANDSLDFVYIDGNHSYNYVLADLEAWWPKVKAGGMLIGDDAYDALDNPARNADGDVPIYWDTNNPTLPSMYGVTKAFVDFANSRSINVVFCNNQAIMVK